MTRSLKISLEGKCAVVTGGSGDLGLAMARSLYEAGARVLISSRGKKRLAEAAKSLGPDCAFFPADVTDLKQVESLMRSAIKKMGRIDILVTAAGAQVRRPALEFTKRQWDFVLSANLSGTFFCCQSAARRMMKQGGGKVITVSSLAAEIGIPNMAAYAASRGAIRQLTKALAVEWAGSGICVNSVGPGRFRTRMTKDLFSDPKVRESFLRLIPMGRAGEPGDIAGATVFLASNLSDYITGQTIYVDGGWLASGGNPLG
ncbi:MAG: glucose 1-dehydrogenase [Deltaproteobacteria bacterium]